MKKKPALQTILDNIDDYSVEQLESLSGQPLWIRQQLVKIRSGTHIEDKRIQALGSALTMEHPQLLFPDAMEVRTWVADTQWLDTMGLALEINTGDLFLLLDPDQGLVLCDNSAIRVKDWSKFLNSTNTKGFHSKQAYLQLCSERRNGNAPIDVPIIGDQPSSPLAQYGVRFK